MDDRDEPSVTSLVRCDAAMCAGDASGVVQKGSGHLPIQIKEGTNQSGYQK